MVGGSPIIKIGENCNPNFLSMVSGFGGWNGNKVASLVKHRLVVRDYPLVESDDKERLIEISGNSVTEGGILIIEAKRVLLPPKTSVIW